MSKELNEQQVLEKLNIPDFRHMTKDKVMEFASMLSKMNPEVAKKALEQFPEFSRMIVDLAKECKGIIEKTFDANDKSVQACNNLLNIIINSLTAEMSKDDIPFEQKQFYVEKIMEVANMQKDLEIKNKEFLGKVAQLAGAAILILGGTAVFFLSDGKIDLKLSDK